MSGLIQPSNEDMSWSSGGPGRSGRSRQRGRGQSGSRSGREAVEPARAAVLSGHSSVRVRLIPAAVATLPVGADTAARCTVRRSGAERVGEAMAPVRAALLLVITAGLVVGQRSSHEDQQLRQLVREAVSEALRAQLADLRCSASTIRKRQVPVRAGRQRVHLPGEKTHLHLRRDRTCLLRLSS